MVIEGADTTGRQHTQSSLKTWDKLRLVSWHNFNCSHLSQWRCSCSPGENNYTKSIYGVRTSLIFSSNRVQSVKAYGGFKCSSNISSVVKESVPSTKMLYYQGKLAARCPVTSPQKPVLLVEQSINFSLS